MLAMQAHICVRLHCTRELARGILLGSLSAFHTLFHYATDERGWGRRLERVFEGNFGVDSKRNLGLCGITEQANLIARQSFVGARFRFCFRSSAETTAGKKSRDTQFRVETQFFMVLIELYDNRF